MGSLQDQQLTASAGPVDSEKYCLDLRQGEGGIYSFPVRVKSPRTGQSHETTTISTTGCLTCVGTYIPIDDDRCFAAHFDASMDHFTDTQTWQIPDNLAPSLDTAVKTLLHQTFQDLQHELETFKQRQDLKDRAIIICPWQVVQGQKGTGYYIINAVCEYFGLEKGKVVNQQNAHGFIIDHANGSSAGNQYLAWERPGPTEQDYDSYVDIASRGSVGTLKERWDAEFTRTANRSFMPDTMGWTVARLEDDSKATSFSIMYMRDGEKWVRTAIVK